MCSTVPTAKYARSTCAHLPLFVGLALLAVSIGAEGLTAQARYDNIDHARGVVSANEEAMIEADVRRTVGLYYEYFSTGQVERIPQETHLVPYIVLGGGATLTAEATAEGYRQRRQMVIDEFDSDYELSTYTFTNICVLSAGSAITSGYNTRTNSSGGLVSVEGVSYMLTKAPQGWRIAAFSPTKTNTVIRCTDD